MAEKREYSARPSNKERIRLYQQEYRQTHKDRLAEQAKAYYLANHEELLAQKRTYNKRPDVRERRRNWFRVYFQNDDVKDRERQRNKQPHRIFQRRVSARIYRKRPDKREMAKQWKAKYESKPPVKARRYELKTKRRRDYSWDRQKARNMEKWDIFAEKARKIIDNALEEGRL